MSNPQLDIRAEIIAIERAALDRSDTGDVDGFLDISDPEVSYFDPSLERPIRGLETLRAYYQGFAGGEPVNSEMTNVDVQLAGDAAVLTFNYATTTVNTGRLTRWNTTEVYRRTPSGWRIIHTHWAYQQPQLAETSAS